MATSARFKMANRNGHAGRSLRPVIHLPVFTRNGDAVAYPPLDFVFDTGAEVCAVSAGLAEERHIPFEKVDAARRNPPLTRGGPLAGWWGNLQIHFLEKRLVLPCFFYEPRPEAGIEGAPAPQSAPLARLIRQLRGEPEETGISVAILGMAVFLDNYNILLQDKHALVSTKRIK